MKDSNFSQFTNLYSLSKTLRFELKPVGNTQNMLHENNIFQIDENRKRAYENTKPYFDKLHREFIAEALANPKLTELNKYFEVFVEFKKNKKDKDIQKRIDNEGKRLREQVVKYFDEKGKEWATNQYSHLKIKKKDLNILFEEQIFQILKDRYGNEEETKLVIKETGEILSIFDNWKGFTGYFGKFFKTRENFYKSDGTSTAIATRIIDQNLNRFLDNLISYKSIKEKIDVNEVEDFFKLKASAVFSTDFYNKCLLQNGIDTYNDFLGGKTLPNGEKKKGVNELINKYRQDNPAERLPFLKKLDKQILSEKETFIDEIQSDEDFQVLLKNFYNSSKSKVLVLQKLFGNFFDNTSAYNLDSVYISKEAFNTISHKWTNETEVFGSSLYKILKDEELISSSAKKEDGSYSFPNFISINQIKKSIEDISFDGKFWKERYYESKILNENQTDWNDFLKIFKFEFNSLFQDIQVNPATGKDETSGYNVFKKDLEEILQDLKINKDSKIIIKNFADQVLHIYQMAKYFAVESKRIWVGDSYELDSQFYNHLEYGFKDKFYDGAYEEIVQAYNKIRNYLTKKAYSQEKWKLNFENPTLADGWDKNKESDNSAVILRKNEKYYLAIMAKGNNKLFDDRNFELMKNGLSEGSYEKLVYKYLPDAAKMIPKCSTQLKHVQKHFQSASSAIEINSKSFINPLKISKRVFDLNNIRFDKSNIEKTTLSEKDGVKQFQKEYFKISNDFKTYKSALTEWIDFCKDFLQRYESTKDFDLSIFKKSADYKSLDEFYADIDMISYKVTFTAISEQYINEKNSNGEMFLFEIHNKDWNLKDGKGKTGQKNLHSLYFEELFSGQNIKNNFIFKLNGQAEIFYRPKTEPDKLEHKVINGVSVINHKRYSENKIFFHVPITLNRVPKASSKFNTEINSFLANNTDINIIGVDRGEKHLAYYSVINQKEEVLKSGTLNTINGVNYENKLQKKAEGREQARRDWQTVEGIKDLKKGYISQVVRKLADLAIEHNAIIVMEDLNMRFKQIRGGIEKSIYQQLEKALIEKLNFLVNKKEINPEKAGHLLKAYQLTAPFDTFKDMGKQTGIIFYTQASYTSKIDPVTGWRPNVYLKYSNVSKAKEDIKKFDEIKYNSQKDRFEFTYDLRKFVVSKQYPKKPLWTLCSNVERFRWDKKLNNNKGGYTHYLNLTNEFKSLFSEFKIDIASNIKEQINDVDNVKFFKDFAFYFGLICQIRNTQQDKEGNENDFILSPVDPFFDSRKADAFGKNLPKNGDDNGAFNIARKGIIILDKISKGTTEWKDLYISNVEWDDFAQRNPRI